jgi:hypothetical protein
MKIILYHLGLKGRDHSEDPGIVEKILEWILNRVGSLGLHSSDPG